MKTVQNGILSAETQFARYMSFSLIDIEEVKDCLQALKEVVDGQSIVVGFGSSLISALDSNISGLHLMPVNTAPGLDVPSTPYALWLWLQGDDRGELLHRSRTLEQLLVSAFELSDVVEGCQYDRNRDLSGYEDGTENPKDEEAIKAAIVQGQGNGLDGSSFVAVQQWVHDFDMLDSMTVEEKDDSIGRHRCSGRPLSRTPGCQRQPGGGVAGRVNTR